MNESIKTGMSDKTGRAIYVNDVVQHRLGVFGKSGGARKFQVIQYGKKYHLVEESKTEYQHGGILLTPKLCEKLVVIASSHIWGE